MGFQKNTLVLVFKYEDGVRIDPNIPEGKPDLGLISIATAPGSEATNVRLFNNLSGLARVPNHHMEAIYQNEWHKYEDIEKTLGENYEFFEERGFFERYDG